jgi:hypothetical protein
LFDPRSSCSMLSSRDGLDSWTHPVTQILQVRLVQRFSPSRYPTSSKSRAINAHVLLPRAAVLHCEKPSRLTQNDKFDTQRHSFSETASALHVGSQSVPVIRQRGGLPVQGKVAEHSHCARRVSPAQTIVSSPSPGFSNSSPHHGAQRQVRQEEPSY